MYRDLGSTPLYFFTLRGPVIQKNHKHIGVARVFKKIHSGARSLGNFIGIAHINAKNRIKIKKPHFQCILVHLDAFSAFCDARPTFLNIIMNIRLSYPQIKKKIRKK